MKVVIAAVRPSTLPHVTARLRALGVSGMTVTESRGFGRVDDHVELYRGTEYRFEAVPRVRVEVLVPDDLAAEAVEAICGSARTGRLGDGRVWVRPAVGAYRVRTGEAGPAAI